MSPSLTHALTRGEDIIFQPHKALYKTYVRIFAKYFEVRHKRYGKRSTDCENSSFESYKYDSSSLYSKVTFSWLLPILQLGNSSPLDFEDLGQIPTAESTQFHFRKFADIYNTRKAKERRKVSLWQCYILHSWRMFTLSGFLKLFGDLVGLVGPLGISAIVRYAQEINQPPREDMSTLKLYANFDEFLSNGYIMGVIVFIATIFQGTFSQNSTHIINVEGIRIKAALQAMIYDKSLRLPLWTLAESFGFDEQEETPCFSRKSSSPKSKSDDKKCKGEKYLKSNAIMGQHSPFSSPLDTGPIANFMSEDTFNVMSFIWISHYVWAIPVKIGVLMFLLHHKLGMGALVGSILCVAIMTPLQFIIGKKMSANSKKISDASDERLRRINEVLHCIKVIKLSGWEDLFERQVKVARNRELRFLNHDSLHWAIMTFLTHASSTLVTLVTFGIYLLLENSPLPTADVFSGLALFNQLTVPLFIFPITVPIIINAMISTKRLEDFLSQPDMSDSSDYLRDATYNNRPSPCALEKKEKVNQGMQPSEEEQKSTTNDDLNCADNAEGHSSFATSTFNGAMEEDKTVKASSLDTSRASSNLIKVENVLFSWHHGSSLSLSGVFIPQGKMTLIVGAVGSGKSSFLLSLLGEMTSLESRLDSRRSIEWTTRTKVAYCSQKPWLLNTTVRENILFGSGYQRRVYNQVVAACALQPDLNILPLRDLTEIGERGINLSGGQKHRLSIARALYSQADVVFMDDPLSALDYQVGQHLVHEGFKKLLVQKGRTLVLVTHCLPLLSEADHIIVLDHGAVISQGSFTDIQTARPDLAQAWKQALTVTQDDQSNEINTNSVRGEKTARERWQLVRLVSRFGLQQQFNADEQALRTGHHYKAISRRHSRSLYGSHNYSYNNFPVPVDECTVHVNECTGRGFDYKINEPIRRTKSTITSSSDVWRRRSIRFHNKVARVSSLQPRDFGGRNIRDSLAYAWSYPVDIEQQKPVSRKNESSPLSKTLCKKHVDISFQLPDRVDTAVCQSMFPCQETTSDKVKKNQEAGTHLIDNWRKCGVISGLVYLSYLKSCTIVACVAYVVSTFMWQVLRVCTDFWLSDWTGYGNGTSENKSINNQSVFQQEMLKYLFGYCILSIGTIVLSLSSNIIGQMAGAKARQVLHQQLVSNLLHCPIKFFDTTPVGSLIDCFSADIAIVDKKLASSIQRLMQFLSLCCSAILVNTILSPWFLLPALPMCVAYYTVQHFYRASSRELHRMDSIARTPILSFFTETLGGLATIRSFGHKRRFMSEMLCKMDTHNNISLILCAANRWLGIALDYLGGAIVLVSIIGLLLAASFHPSVVTPSHVGLAVNYTLLVPIYLNWVVKFMADVEMYMSSVERINHFGNLQGEHYTMEGLQVSANWPEKGEIIFKDVTLQYDDSREPVITKLNLHIPAGQKVGLCGRTGSGKSSLVMALFRMLEVREGNILMDDVDICHISLHVLRSRLSIIPQDVVMFSGTIRLNLDPYGIYSEDEIWNSLELAQLTNTVQKLPGRLDALVKEGGENFSVGTRQLFCLARAILHNAAVLIMDEATSSVDPTTEHALLSAALRAFSHRTVIIIAHRLSTIVDCDRVLVLDAGNIVEDGHPSKLLRCDNGVFTLMLRAGSQTTK